MQANVGRKTSAHETALNLAYEGHIDIILIQEPSIRSHERRLTRTHPAYETFAPIDDWVENRPRVMTYICKGTGLRGEQCRPVPTPSSDLLFLQILWDRQYLLTIINIYNAPQAASQSGRAIQDILDHYHLTPSDRYILAGDFNLHHPNWQPTTTYTSLKAQDLVDWAESADLVLTSPIGEPTHRAGNVLDLSWASASLPGVYTSIETSLNTTSDHETLLTWVLLPALCKPKTTFGKFRLDTMDKELFLSTLQRNI